jgi:hypothetical protein
MEKPQEEPKQIKCYCGHTSYCDCGPLDETKQETLEEVVNNFKKTDVYINEIKQEQERMYSEEDLFKILLDFVAFPHDHMESRGSIIERYLKELKKK